MGLKREDDERTELFHKALRDLEETYESHGAHMHSRGEMKSDPRTLQRWQCRGKGMIGRHPMFWMTADEVIEHGRNGRNACPICRESVTPEEITFQQLVDGVAEQEKREEKSLQKSRRGARRGGYVDKYAIGSPV